MDRRTEQEYKQALDSLRYSSEGKERIMKNLMERQEQRPEKRKSIRPLRTVLIAAALCLALVGTAFSAASAVRQAHITYIDRDRFTKEYDEYLEEHGHSSAQYNDGHYTGADFNGWDAEDWESWWQNPGAELVEEIAGTARDGWTAKRVFKSDLSSTSYGLRLGQTYEEIRYQAERASDYGSLWSLWDLSWLEGRYAANSWGTFARTITCGDKLRFLALGGEYQDGETRFNIGFSWNSSFVHGDEYRVAGNQEFAELYTTRDGVEAAIEMDTSKTGKSVFWVNVWNGHNFFDMSGTQMELDELHDILDSLNLSALLEYAPE